VAVAVRLLHRCCLVVPRLLIAKEGAGLLPVPRLGSCLGRKRLCLAAFVVEAWDAMVAAAADGVRFVARVGVGGVVVADDSRVVVHRRKPVPAAVAAAVVIAHLSALHSQGLRS